MLIVDWLLYGRMDLGDMVDTSLSSHGYMYPRASGLGSTHGGGGTSSASSTQNSGNVTAVVCMLRCVCVYIYSNFIV